MFEKNSFPVGLLVAVLVPAAGYLVFYGVFEILESLGWVNDGGFRPRFRERTIGIVALGLNALALNYYQKRYYFHSVRGIVVVTVLLVGLWLYLYGEYVL